MHDTAVMLSIIRRTWHPCGGSRRLRHRNAAINSRKLMWHFARVEDHIPEKVDRSECPPQPHGEASECISTETGGGTHMTLVARDPFNNQGRRIAFSRGSIWCGRSRPFWDANRIRKRFAALRRIFSQGSTTEQNWSRLITTSSLLRDVRFLRRKLWTVNLTFSYIGGGIDRDPWGVSQSRPNQLKDCCDLSLDFSKFKKNPLACSSPMTRLT